MSRSAKKPSRNEPIMTLRHYIAGSAPHSARATANLKFLCAEYLDDRCSIETVDIFEHPLRALEDAVYVCPTLLKLSPPPVRKIVGDLSDREAVLFALGIEQVKREKRNCPTQRNR